MSGTMHVVVGPSGSGKDTLIDGAKALLPHTLFAKRTVTRPADAGGEDFIGVDQTTFDQQVAEGKFCVHWRANNLSYGIPVEICQQAAAGTDVVFNGSRAALKNICACLPAVQVVWIEVAPEVLAQRLRQRGRESEAEIKKRLQRQQWQPPKNATIISNNGTIEEGVQALVAALSGQRVTLDQVKTALLAFTTKAEV
ncbi:phosphonate metabolism protein/1,5-bisphosphokinase (PRPP-forming) PhnN [Reinekea thalattae]|uniref:Ribose 1,5-bisphosphate phosphokinase PhnN n=1 Tax=Reinekea thalattae TaxID=2593301 RepID=A0A5C8ZAR5_9GAMM|nr:phosphonate metabolism protein/1,5-bisphosphokinase (PRPP-forming) PhnN [Reinekea thalattae]TXR54534.1 phosphonate metabolism protein/1,5-bisphosphokinase (PRPP-forming) PhnN [Reinekea thalattae]